MTIEEQARKWLAITDSDMDDPYNFIEESRGIVVKLLAELALRPPIPAPDGSSFSNPQAPLMWATIRAPSGPDGKLEVGQLAIIEVPANCTIHATDAARMARIIDIGERMGEHWRTQEGINASLLEEMAEATRPL